MLIKDILTESAKDERFIQRIAQGIVKAVEAFKQSHRMPNYWEPGTVGEITGLTGETDSEKYLTTIGVMFLKFPKNFANEGGGIVLGAYRPAEEGYSADIGFDVRYLANDEELKKHKAFQKIISMPGKDLASSITHELRHALDDYLSKGKYDKGPKKDYYDQPHEINARFSEVMHKLQQRIEAGEVNRNTFLEILKTELLRQNIKPTPRLIKRAYDFFAN